MKSAKKSDYDSKWVNKNLKCQLQVFILQQFAEICHFCKKKLPEKDIACQTVFNNFLFMPGFLQYRQTF